MNEIRNILLAGDKFVLEMHLKQPGFTYSACDPFTKNKERMKKNQRNRRIKVYLLKRITKVLLHKAFNIAKNANYDGY